MTPPTPGQREERARVTALQQLASRGWPDSWHPGGVGWALARGELGRQVALFEENGCAMGWAAGDQHASGERLAQVDPHRPDAVAAVVDWLIGDAPQGDLTIEVTPTAVALRDGLEAAGFAPRIDLPVLGMRRPAPGPEPVLPDGYELRAVREDELAARVEVHRAAWRPADLPWRTEDGPAVDPDASSSFTAAAYAAVRDTWLYEPTLDLVAVAPDGSLAGCCIAWLDPASGVAEIEPMGVVPDHRRRGLAVALCHEVGARVARAGGQELFINTGRRDEYPAPGAAYARAGFVEYERATTYVRPAT